ncbi:hypothetical protein EVAR_56874_1 [Eumeta japonica]|uniref:Uncharacterized protein n=1 Tax=Eumeta variegata TaxID=151549 RepID=A0A4C1Z605_EUMVA|nr:hypothetical protein EVAR_56874_1 [Eumeta japonica]
MLIHVAGKRLPPSSPAKSRTTPRVVAILCLLLTFPSAREPASLVKAVQTHYTGSRDKRRRDVWTTFPAFPWEGAVSSSNDFILYNLLLAWVLRTTRADRIIVIVNRITPPGGEDNVGWR